MRLASPRHIGSRLLVLLLLAGTAHAQDARWETDILRDTFGYRADMPSDVPWNELMQGCGQRDCIPSLDEPRFVAAAEARFLADDDVVMGLKINGDARAYPVLIMNYHEIVNDVVGGQPVAITYCPLCGSGLAFERSFSGRVVEFGVSGLLRNNDLVLYDRQTESLWQQITGRAFAGRMRGQELRAVPAAMTTWGRWRAANPQTRVLSTATGFDRPYANRSPYGDYESSERLLFPVSFDQRLHPKAVVYGVEAEVGSYAVTEEALADGSVIEHPSGSGWQWRLAESGMVEVTQRDTGAQLVAHRMFWFAWYSFHVDTELYVPGTQ